jgi:hypothetical protein
MTKTGTEITAGLIRELLREQHPDLAELPLREVTGGWGLSCKLDGGRCYRRSAKRGLRRFVRSPAVSRLRGINSGAN